MRLQRRRGKFYYVINNQWLPLGSDQNEAVAKATAMNEASRTERIEACSMARYVSAELARIVMQRDEGKCVYCGATERLEFDHVIPASKGGATSIGNVVVSCMSCNASKNDGTIAEFMVKLHRVVERCLEAATKRA